MSNHSETLTDGIHQILFGFLKPDRVIERYEQNQTDHDLYHILTEFPASPESYLSLHETIRTWWEKSFIGTEVISRMWLPPFFTLPADSFNAFHILCDFYSSFIRAECRMMIQVSETWKNILAISTLKYELLTLRNGLLDLIRESSQRLSHHPAQDGTLSRFVYEQLLNNLLITFFELQIRSGHLFEEKIISNRELFLKYLKQSEPRDTPWHRSTALTRFELESALRTPEMPDQLRAAENLLLNLRRDSSPGHQKKIQDSINILENAWLCLFISNESGSWKTLDLLNPEQCAQEIEEVHQQMYQNSDRENHSHSRQIVELVIQNFERLQSVLNTGSAEETSAAGRLIRAIQSYYEGNSEVPVPTDPESTGNPVIREVPESTILDQFIPVDDLKEKLDVTHKSMNHYLSKSNTPVHKFSNKTRLIHVNDFKAMMEHFKTTL